MTVSHTTSPFATSLRTHLAGSLRVDDAGATVRLGGWVHRSRNLGGIVFIDLRDREGIVQVSFGTDWATAGCIAQAAAVGVESVVMIEGTVVARSADTRNAEMGSGDVEVRATSIEVVGPAETPAIPVARGKGEKLSLYSIALLSRQQKLDTLYLREKAKEAIDAYEKARGK